MRFFLIKLLGAVLAFAVVSVSAQPSFSIKTTSEFPSILGADFGYKIGRFQPFFGLSNYRISAEVSETYNPDTFGQSSTNDMSASMYITSIGFRYGFRDDGIIPYVHGNLYKLFTFVDVEGMSSSERKVIEEPLSPFGLGVGFGTEYAFNENFSVFGEYGLRAFFPSSETTRTDDFEDPPQQITTKVSAMFSVLNGAAGMRFYF